MHHINLVSNYCDIFVILVSSINVCAYSLKYLPKVMNNDSKENWQNLRHK